MPKISELAESNYLKKEDVGGGLIVTMDKVSRKNLAKEDQPAEYKYLLHFQEEDVKPLVLNVTNGQIISELVGTDEMDDWRGKEICLYNDPNVMFGTERKGGIRVKSAHPEKAEPPRRAGKPAPPSASPDQPEDDIPF